MVLCLRTVQRGPSVAGVHRLFSNAWGYVDTTVRWVWTRIFNVLRALHPTPPPLQAVLDSGLDSGLDSSPDSGLDSGPDSGPAPVVVSHLAESSTGRGGEDAAT